VVLCGTGFRGRAGFPCTSNAFNLRLVGDCWRRGWPRHCSPALQAISFEAASTGGPVTSPSALVRRKWKSAIRRKAPCSSYCGGRGGLVVSSTSPCKDGGFVHRGSAGHRQLTKASPPSGGGGGGKKKKSAKLVRFHSEDRSLNFLGGWVPTAAGPARRRLEAVRAADGGARGVEDDGELKKPRQKFAPHQKKGDFRARRGRVTEVHRRALRTRSAGIVVGLIAAGGGGRPHGARWLS